MKSEQVFEKIKKYVTSGEWKRGEKIPSEIELAKSFAVSRNTIRGHIQRLVALGVLVVRHGEGTFVNDNSIIEYILNSFIPIMTLEKNEFIDMLEFQNEVIVESVRSAALDRSEEDLAKIFESITSMRKYSKDIRMYIGAKYDLDIDIVTISKNKLLVEMIVKIKEILLDNVVKYLGEIVDATEIDEYEKLYLAIIRQDVADAHQRYNNIININLVNITENTKDSI